MPVRFPLSTLLSHILVAFTVELDNAFERRLRDSGQTPRVTSFVMWANFMRFVGDGITVAELPDATGIPKARTLSTLGGMERWRYVSVGPNSETRRDGSGSGRGLRPDWVVRPTAAGRAAAAIWRPLADEIEERWAERFGAAAVGELRLSLEPIARRPELALPEYIPIVGGASWTVVDAVSRRDARRRVAGSVVRAPLSCAPRLRARVRTRGRARIAAERQRRARSRREGHEREGRGAARRHLEGSRGDGDDLPREARLRGRGGEGHPPDGDRAARRRRAPSAGTPRSTLAGPHKPAPGFARRSPTCSNGRICSRCAYDRRRAAGAAASRTSRRPRPCSRIRPGRCRTTRWCCTAAAGRTGASS